MDKIFSKLDILGGPINRVIYIECTKHSLVSLDYSFKLFSRFSLQQKQELLAGRKYQISNKSFGVKPFTDRVVAVSFRDHFIKDSYRIFKGQQEQCLSFLDFYLEDKTIEFCPKEFIYRTKYGNILKFDNIQDFKDAVRK